MKTRPISVLLVEDNPADARFIRKMLSEVTSVQFELTYIRRLNEALKYLNETYLDVILLDFSLPNDQGFDTFAKIHRRVPNVPIVVLSNVADEALALQTVQEGAQDYLVKSHLNPNMLTRVLLYAVERYRLLMELQERTQQFQSSETRLRKIIEKNADGIIIGDTSGRVRFVNPAAEVLFGRKAEELLGTYFEFHKVEGETTEIKIRRERGETPVAEVRTVETEWEGERAYLASLRDITERKQIDRMKNEFISTVSHEIRTPLTSILGSLGLMAGGVAGELPAQAKVMIDIAHRNSERLMKLINDILDIEKIESGRMVFHLKPIELVPLVEQAIEANRAYGQQFGVKFVLDKTLPGNIGQVNVDSDRLMQVFANLLSNAAKFSPPNDQVVISVSRHDGVIRVAITDHGYGIPTEFHNRIFEKFTQADASDNRRKGGTGLGLSICKTIVEKLSGQIGFETETNMGTTFYFDLPEWRETREIAVAPTLPSLPPGQALPDQPRILVCEDDRDIATLLSMMLNQAGFYTRIAHNATSAKQLLAQNQYAAMILDILLPDEDGLSLIRELREDERTRHLPIVAVSVTADHLHQRLVDGGAMSIIDWMSKPIDSARLIAAVKQATQSSGGDKPYILHVEDNPAVLEMVSEMLHPIADVSFAVNLRDAQQKLDQEAFDLVILDAKLPDGNGMELLPILHSRMPPIPIVIFSAYEMTAEIARQVSAALVKSRISNQELLETIQSLIKRNHSTVRDTERMEYPTGSDWIATSSPERF